LLARELENQEMREELTIPQEYFMIIWVNTNKPLNNISVSYKFVKLLAMSMERLSHITALV